MNIVLTGFMGTGKTTVGKRLALRLKLKFVDTDHEVEKIIGMTVKEIFKKHGERRFRSEETAAISRLSRQDMQVIATGGGAVLSPLNMEFLRRNGIIFCLTADPDTIYQRVSTKKTRPLLEGQEDLRAKIVRLLLERKDAYANADYIINTSGRYCDEVVEDIVRIYMEEVMRDGNS